MDQGTTTTAKINIYDFLTVCIQLAQASGKVIRHFGESGKNQSTMTVKADRSRLTLADLLVQRTVTYNLKQIYGPSLSINGEEDTKECEALEPAVSPDVIRRDGILDMALMKETKDRRQALVITKSILGDLPELGDEFDASDASVWIDPVDGTNCFVKSWMECVTVIIGLSIKGRARIGIVHSEYFIENFPGLPQTLSPRTFFATLEHGPFYLSADGLQHILPVSEASHLEAPFTATKRGSKPLNHLP